MSNFANYLEEKLLGHTLLGSSFTAPATVHISLATSLASDGDSFTEVLSGLGYVRLTASGFFTAPTSSNDWTVSTSIDLTFAAATTPWGTVTHFAFHDALAIGAGNMLYWAAMDTPRAIITADVLEFQAGQITVALD